MDIFDQIEQNKITQPHQDIFDQIEHVEPVQMHNDIFDQIAGPSPPKKKPISAMAAAGETLKNIAHVTPAAETAAHLTTMAYGLPVAGATGMAGSLKQDADLAEEVIETAPFTMGMFGATGLDFEKGEKVIDKAAETLIYQPQTEGGKQLTSAAMYPFEKLHELGVAAGEAVHDETGSALAGTVVQTAIEALPVFLPLVKKAGGKLPGKKSSRAKETTPKKNAEAEVLQEQFAAEFLSGETPVPPPPPKVELPPMPEKKPWGISRAQEETRRAKPKEEIALDAKTSEALKADALAELAEGLREVSNREPVRMPTELAEAFEIMKEEVGQGGVQKSIGENSHIIGRTYPAWFRKGKWSRKEFDTLVRKSEAGEPLTARQRERFEQLRESAEEMNSNHPDLVVGQEAADLAKKGYEPIFDEINASDLEVPGDRAIIKDEVFTSKGYDKNGQVVLEDGKTYRLDPWDTLDVDGVKKGGPPLRDTRVPVEGDTFKWLGVEPGNVFADYSALQSKHKEQFRSPEEVRSHVEHVLEKPDYKLPATKEDYTLLVRSNGSDRAAVVEFVLKGGKYRVRSAYTMSRGQLEAKLQKIRPQGGRSEPPAPARSPQGEISSGSPTTPSDAVHPAAEKTVAVPDKKVKPGDPEGGTTLYSGLPVPEMAKLYRKVGDKVWDDWVVEKLPKALEKIPGGKAVNRAMVYDYRGDLPMSKAYIESMGKMKRNQTIGAEYGIDLGKRLQSVSENEQIRMGQYIRGENTLLAKPAKALADEAKTAMLQLGKQAVDAGLLAEKTFFENAGRYMPRLYSSKEYQTLLDRFNVAKPNRMDLSRFKKRKDIPLEVREQMGEILTPGYPIAKGVVQLTHDIEMAKFFKGIAETPEWAVKKNADRIPEGFVQLPANRKLGNLSEAYVHPEIFGDLNEAIRVMSQPEKVWRKALGAWKFGKVILSPKTHARNLMSNSVLAHLGGLPMYEQPWYLARAAREMRNQGEYWRKAKREGLLSDTFTNAELRTLFERVEGQMEGVKAGSMPEQLGRIGSGWEKSKSALNKAAKLYEAEEQWFKLSKFIHNMDRKKMSAIEAAADSEKWLFNYAKVTKFQDAYRSKWYGAPFATFTFKALPRIAEAAVKTPHRFILPAMMIHGLERAAMDKFGDTRVQAKAKRELLPEWMRGSMLGMPNFARFPILDESGREYYLNLTYILPWGDIGEGGGFGPVPGSLMPFTQPFVKEPWQQVVNYDTFWKENIVKESDVAGKSLVERMKTEGKIRGKHAFNAMAPTPLIDATKAVAALRKTPDYRGRTRPGAVVAADVLAGIKLYPVDYAEQAAREIRRADPERGELAMEIKREISSLYRKLQAVKESGGDTSGYQEQIDDKIDQLNGLAEEVKTAGSRLKVSQGKQVAGRE